MSKFEHPWGFLIESYSKQVLHYWVLQKQNESKYYKYDSVLKFQTQTKSIVNDNYIDRITFFCFSKVNKDWNY